MKDALRLLGWFYGQLFRGLADSTLVFLGLKWQPPTGRPVWRK